MCQVRGKYRGSVFRVLELRREQKPAAKGKRGLAYTVTGEGKIGEKFSK